MANVIEQIVQPASFDGQTIEITVRSNERGPQGEQGEPGEPASVTAGNVYSIEYGEAPSVINSGTSSDAVLDFYLPKGQPGAVHYTAGPGISITDDNVIEATGGMAVYWGNIKGTLGNQTDLASAINAKQNQLTAGTNITIANNTISAASYTAGSGLDLTNGAFSVDTGAIQTKLTAGSNVQINGSTISATDTTYNNFIGADGGSGGSAGLVPAPVATDNVKVLQGNGTWASVGTNNISNSAVTTAKINDGSVTTAKINDNAITAAKIDFSTLSGNYSTTEQNTGYTWIDGSPIYKKTVNFGALPNNTTKTVSYNISGLNRVIKIEGWAYRSSDGKSIPIPFSGIVDGSTGYSIDTSVVSGDIRLVSQKDFSNFTESYITLYYTKT